jgi:hypothetical protein
VVVEDRKVFEVIVELEVCEPHVHHGWLSSKEPLVMVGEAEVEDLVIELVTAETLDDGSRDGCPRKVHVKLCEIVYSSLPLFISASPEASEMRSAEYMSQYCPTSSPSLLITYVLKNLQPWLEHSLAHLLISNGPWKTVVSMNESLAGVPGAGASTEAPA